MEGKEAASRIGISRATGAGVEGSMTELKADQGRVVEGIHRREISLGLESSGRRFTLAAGLTVLSVTLGVLVAWRTSSSLLIIFAAILFASFLDACARALGPMIPFARAWRLSLVVLLLTALMVLGARRGVGKFPSRHAF
jgi:hypothetical protein